jgi:hypothetical protein
VLPDPFVVLAAGRCLVRYHDLLKLADLNAGQEQACRIQQQEEDTP